MKNSEIMRLNEAELFETLKDLKREHMNLRFQVKLMADNANPNKLCLIRRNIARIMTEIKKRKK